MTIFMLNSGHGINTPGKRSPFIPPGVLEYEFNIYVAKKIVELSKSYGDFECVHIDPVWKNAGCMY